MTTRAARTARATIGLVIGISGWVALAAAAGAEGPIRLDEAQLDRITAGTIAAEADALAFAAGDRFAVTTTDTTVKTLLGPFVEVSVAIAHAGAAACCAGPVGALASAAASGEVSVRHDFGVEHANPHLNQALALSVAVGVTRRPPAGAPSTSHELWSIADPSNTDAGMQKQMEPRPRGHYGSRPVSGRAKAM